MSGVEEQKQAAEQSQWPYECGSSDRTDTPLLGEESFFLVSVQPFSSFREVVVFGFLGGRRGTSSVPFSCASAVLASSSRAELTDFFVNFS